MRLVEEARESKSGTQLLADRTAGWLFYVALGVAAVTAVAWTAAAGFGLEVVERSVTVLVIACPHALGLAIPLVVSINTSMAASNGVLVRDRIAMEEARNLDVVMFDKTGTLTKGEHGVVDAATVEEWGRGDSLALAAAAESDSEHVVAKAILDAAKEEGIEAPNSTEFEAIEGRGVRAEVDGDEVYVGGPTLLKHLETEPPTTMKKLAEESGQKARTVTYLVVNGETVAAYALADVIREESRTAIDALHEWTSRSRC